jgi:hypothetical protein
MRYPTVCGVVKSNGAPATGRTPPVMQQHVDKARSVGTQLGYALSNGVWSCEIKRCAGDWRNLACNAEFCKRVIRQLHGAFSNGVGRSGVKRRARRIGRISLMNRVKHGIDTCNAGVRRSQMRSPKV